MKKIRNLIAEDRLPKAHEELLKLTPEEFRNDVVLLQSQLNNWERNKHLNLGAPIEERNRIIYATLYMVSRIEKASKTGKEARKIETLAAVEADLVKGYEKLLDLRTNGAMDLFNIWLMDHYPKVFQQLLEEEQRYGKAVSFEQQLSHLNIEHFISMNQLEASAPKIRQYMIHQNENINNFFTGWIKYNQHRSNFASSLDREIDKYESHYKKIITGGLFGGVLGAIGLNFFERTMDQVIEMCERGEYPDPDPEPDPDPDPDDDDDD